MLEATAFEMLANFAPFALDNIYRSSGMACYGDGDTGNWSVQPNLCVFAALAVLAASPEYRDDARISRDELGERALELLRYSLRTHLTGDRASFNGKKWGCTWISALALERMAHGVEALGERLSREDRERYRALLCAECDFLTDRYEIVADVDAATWKNKPESNLWNGALLCRSALLFPDLPRREAYWERGCCFLANSISIAADRADRTIWDGKPLSARHIGANFTENFGLHHHEYLNIGYMVICLSNLAMFHFSCRKKHLRPPEMLYLHAADLWRQVKYFTCSDGRLWRTGGDMRVRYCYCQDYAIPVYLWAAEYLHDPDGIRLAEGLLRQIAQEQRLSPKGSFLGNRLEELRRRAPVYYLRLEGDRAAGVSYALDYLRHFPEIAEAGTQTELPVSGVWTDAFHGAAAVRSPRRLVSFVREARTKPTLLTGRPEDSDLMEWHWNGVGCVEGFGVHIFTEFEQERIQSFSGGFAGSARWRWMSSEHVAEGVAPEVAAVTRFAVAALPDEATTLLIEYAVAPHLVYLKRVKGLHWQIPNDLFNGMSRTLEFNGKLKTFEGIPEHEESFACTDGTVRVPGRLAIRRIYGEMPVVLRPAGRQISIHDPFRICYGHAGGNLHALEVCAPLIAGPRRYVPGETLYDNAYALVVGTESGGRLNRIDAGDSVRAVLVDGQNGRRYFFAVNFGSEPVRIAPPAAGRFLIGTPAPDGAVVLEPDDIILAEFVGA